MKNNYFLLAMFAFLGISTVFAQRGENFERDYEPIRKELNDWDPVRGEWLSSSFVAIADQTPIPDRNFPENITPNQMLDFVPTQTLSRIRALSAGFANDQGNADAVFWGDVNAAMTRPDCQPVSGRSYGDPHLQSFDGARYSFQTVGEFELAKSNNGRVEVQTRQKARRDDFSLNTAVAMNVNGDRVCLYAEDNPGIGSSSLQVNGQAVNLQGRTYFLNNGGTIRFDNNMYIVDWPTGESVSARIRNSGSMSFMNVTFNVFPCTNGGYSGLLGNANGIERDDYNTSRGVAPVRMVGAGIGGESSEFIREQRQAYIAKEFADEHRITQATSLFDYPIGMSTFTFTDRSFPRVFRSIDDLDDDRRRTAQRNCEENGISGLDLNGCIYDNAFLDIPPSKKHIVRNPAEGIRIERVPGTTPNTNTTPYVKKPLGRKTEAVDEVETPAQPRSERLGGDDTREETKEVPTWEPKSEPIRNKTPETESKPFEIKLKPRGNSNPRPTPSRKPSSPRPSTPKPSGRIGGGR